MKKLVKALWEAEPVAILTALATAMPVVLSGLAVFKVAEGLSQDQTLWLTGLPSAIALVLGFNVRARVSPTNDE